MNRVSFDASCDYLLDNITIEMLNVDVNDKDQIRILTDNARHLRDAKRYGKGRLRKWLESLTPGDILKMVFSFGMFHYILNKEDEGKIVTSRAKDWIFWNRSPR